MIEMPPPCLLELSGDTLCPFWVVVIHESVFPMLVGAQLTDVGI